jgi:hypothetical protein
MEQKLNKVTFISLPLKEYADYVDRYKIANIGKIWSIKKKTYLNTIKSNGYNIVYFNIIDTKKTKMFRVDILIASSFLGNSDKYLQHLDNDNYNDHLDNLKWIDTDKYLEQQYSDKWKTIDKLPNYYISNTGQVWSTYTNSLIKQQIVSGYSSVMIGYPKSIFSHVHRLVAQAFCKQNKIEQNIVNHIDSDKFNNNSDNLEWCTTLENNLHGIKNKHKNIPAETFKYKHTSKYVDLSIELEKYIDYHICGSGHIYSSKSFKYLTEVVNDNGYLRVHLALNDKGKKMYIHRLIAEAWLDPPLINQTQVNHKNRNRKDNRVENLEWCTVSENNRHSATTNPEQYKHLQKKVAQIDIETDNIIKIHLGIKLASKNTKTNSGSIVKVCKNIRKTAGGYKWKYIDQ